MSSEILEVDCQVPSDVISHVLSPYRENCRYVKSATISEKSGSPRSMTLCAKLSVPCCYYAAAEGNGTAHFNATEFVIGFNRKNDSRETS